jgi:hypothetical protein
MRDVLSASLAGIALLALSSLVVLAQTTTPGTPPGNATAAPADGIADWWWVILLVIVIAAAADDSIGRRAYHEQGAAESDPESCQLGLEGRADAGRPSRIDLEGQTLRAARLW